MRSFLFFNLFFILGVSSDIPNSTFFYQINNIQFCTQYSVPFDYTYYTNNFDSIESAQYFISVSNENFNRVLVEFEALEPLKGCQNICEYYQVFTPKYINPNSFVGLTVFSPVCTYINISVMVNYTNIENVNTISKEESLHLNILILIIFGSVIGLYITICSVVLFITIYENYKNTLQLKHCYPTETTPFNFQKQGELLDEQTKSSKNYFQNV